MNAENFQTKDGALVIAGRPVELPFPVQEVVECQDSIIVMIEPSAGVIFNRNVFAFSAQGELIWQIEECPHGTEVDKPFIGISCNNDDRIIASNWIGVDYLVDARSGGIAATAFNK